MDYLLKSMLCLLALLLVHRLLLQREVLHRFNRFFLLFSVVVSFLIPLNSIELPVKEQNLVTVDNLIAEQMSPIDYRGFSESSVQGASAAAPEIVVQVETPQISFPWESVLWSVYLLVSFVFLIRFLRNLGRLLSKIRLNSHLSYRGETLVLHTDNQSPFSFLKYIFVNKSYFELGKLSPAIFAHEQAHVQEKHSWDIIFLEVLTVFFWFNPGLYLAKIAIRLNHEFLADQAALQSTELKDYQNQLLTEVQSGGYVGMSSSLNYSLTKKRLNMMMKITKTSTKWLKIGALIPIGALLIFVFSDKVLAYKAADGSDKPTAALSENLPETRSPAMEAYLDKYGKYQLSAYENFIFKNRTIAELQALFGVYLEFDALFLNLSLEERLMVKRPEFPYVRLEKDGVEYYKKLNELNADERKKIGC